jgi:hypothetical protein
VSRPRELVLRASEALEDDDPEYAGELLDAALAGLHGEPQGGAALCPFCRLDCRWRGALADHLRNVHGAGWEAA